MPCCNATPCRGGPRRAAFVGWDTAQRKEGIDLIAIERRFADGNRLLGRPTVPLRCQQRQAIDGAGELSMGPEGVKKL